MHRQLQYPHDVQGHRLGRPDQARPAAERAVLVGAARQGRSTSLPRHLDNAEPRHPQYLSALLVLLQRIAELLLDGAAVLVHPKIDEVAHDQSAQVPQPQLARDLIGGLQVQPEGRFLRVPVAA